LIALDAFLGERTIKLLQRYRHTDIINGKEVVDKTGFIIHHNTVKLNTQDKFYCYSDTVLWDKELNSALAKGERIVICSFKSATNTELEAQRIQDLFPKKLKV